MQKLKILWNKQIVDASFYGGGTMNIRRGKKADWLYHPFSPLHPRKGTNITFLQAQLSRKLC